MGDILNESIKNTKKDSVKRESKKLKESFSNIDYAKGLAEYDKKDNRKMSFDEFKRAIRSANPYTDFGEQKDVKAMYDAYEKRFFEEGDDHKKFESLVKFERRSNMEKAPKSILNETYKRLLREENHRYNTQYEYDPDVLVEYVFWDDFNEDPRDVRMAKKYNLNYEYMTLEGPLWSGRWEDMNNFCNDYLDYEFHPDYLFLKGECDIITPEEEAEWNKPETKYSMLCLKDEVSIDRAKLLGLEVDDVNDNIFYAKGSADLLGELTGQQAQDIVDSADKIMSTIHTVSESLDESNQWDWEFETDFAPEAKDCPYGMTIMDKQQPGSITGVPGYCKWVRSKEEAQKIFDEFISKQDDPDRYWLKIDDNPQYKKESLDESQTQEIEKIERDLKSKYGPHIDEYIKEFIDLPENSERVWKRGFDIIPEEEVIKDPEANGWGKDREGNTVRFAKKNDWDTIFYTKEGWDAFYNWAVSNGKITESLSDSDMIKDANHKEDVKLLKKLYPNGTEDQYDKVASAMYNNYEYDDKLKMNGISQDKIDRLARRHGLKKEALNEGSGYYAIKDFITNFLDKCNYIDYNLVEGHSSTDSDIIIVSYNDKAEKLITKETQEVLDSEPGMEIEIDGQDVMVRVGWDEGAEVYFEEEDGDPFDKLEEILNDYFSDESVLYNIREMNKEYEGLDEGIESLVDEYCDEDLHINQSDYKIWNTVRNSINATKNHSVDFQADNVMDNLHYIADKK